MFFEQLPQQLVNGIILGSIYALLALGYTMVYGTEVGGYKVLSARDYKLDTVRNMETGEVKPTGLPASNVLYYDMNDGAWICVRPSGTEPKIKFYYGIKGGSLEDAEAKAAALGEAVMAMVDQML